MSKHESKNKSERERGAGSEAKTGVAPGPALASSPAQTLRERREAANPKPIDTSIHFSLPLTRAFVPVMGAAILAYLLSTLGERMGQPALYQGGLISCSVLFIVGSVIWFVSRSQAKKLTREARAAQGFSPVAVPASTQKDAEEKRGQREKQEGEGKQGKRASKRRHP